MAGRREAAAKTSGGEKAGDAATRRRAELIHNPCSGTRRRRLEAVEDALERIGYPVEGRETRQPGHATELARRAAERGVEVIFSLGGDGTLREIAAGLLGTSTALAPLPAGTANVVALELGLPLDPLRAVAALASARLRKIDVGLCAGAVFLMQASAGFDARVVSRVPPALKRTLGKAAFVVTGLRELWRYETPKLRFAINGETRESSFVAACNMPLYGGRFRLAPDAALDSGGLEVVSFRGRGRLAVLSFGLGLMSGRHVKRNDVDLEAASRVELLGSGDLDIQLDGDAFRFALPAEIRLAPEKLVILSP